MSVDLFTVYSYGGGETLYYIFNAIAMLFKHDIANKLFQIMTMLGLIWAGLKSSSAKDKFRPYVKWFLGYMLVILVLIQPPSIFGDKGSMKIHVRDVITGYAKSIDNLPPGLVIPASTISGIGYSVTKVFEAAFTLADVNYLPYSQYGTMFGAQVMSELRNYKIQDPVFKENMESYISNCMMYDVMIGKKYDIQELSNSKDVLQLLIDKSSSLRRFNYRYLGNGGRALLTCKAGITEIAKSFSGEGEQIAKRFPVFSKIANHSSKQSTNQGFLKALDVSLNFYGSLVGTDAAQQLKQILIINAFKDKPASYGSVRSTQHQNTVWKYTGEIAQQMLPILHALFQALIYASFPFIACILFFPGGFRILGTYLGMMIWIELWCPLFAVFNLIVSVFAKAAGGINEITIDSMTNIASTQYSYAMAAMSLGMLIPTLSYMIVKGGAGQFVHVAGQMLGATSSSLSSTAQEIVSGNRTLNHISIGDKSLHNVSANKFDTTGSIATGQMTSVDSSGKRVTELASGDVVITSGKGITVSTTSTDFSSINSVKQNALESAQEKYAQIAHDTKEYSTAQQTRENQSIEWLARMAEAKSKGENYALSGQVSDVSRVDDLINQTITTNKQKGIDFKAAVSATLGTPKAFSAGGDISMAMSYNQSVTDMDSQSAIKTKEHALDSITRVSKDSSYSDSQSAEKVLAENISKSYETMQQKRESISINQSHAQEFEKIHSQIDSMGHEEKRAEEQNILKFIASKIDTRYKDHNIKIGYLGAHAIMENPNDPRNKEYISAYFRTQIPDQSINTANWKDRVTIDKISDKISNAQISNDVIDRKKDIQTKEFSGFSIDGVQLKKAYASKQKEINQKFRNRKLKK